LTRLAVVGGGIAGLAAAWQARHDAEITVFEPGPIGGKLRTEAFEGRPVDCGADAFLTRVPQAVALAEELGLGDELVAPSAGQALVWSGGALHPLPAELVLGAPTRVGPLLRSGLVSPLGAARAALDLVLPASNWNDDVSVYELVRRRFGHQVAAGLVDPLVGSIHAGRTDELSAAATAPQLLAAARRSRSLMLGLRAATKAGPATGGPMFLAPGGGMGELVERLEQRLRLAGVTFRSEAVATIGELGTYDGIILALPAARAATILGDLAPAGLGAIPTASVTLVTMAYAAADLRPPPATSGELVARVGAKGTPGMLMTACSFAGAKWPHWSVPGQTLLRVSCGRDGDVRPTAMADAELVERLGAELRLVVGATGDPLAWRVTRWADAFPQYRVGHLELVAAMETTLRRTAPGVRLAGASYQGAGIPACIASGRRAAASLLEGP
jgi:oxygen-dependent protoporphyrinogen oxidase